jgi:hypothetical protein
MHTMEGNRIVMLDIQKNGSIVERIPGVGQDSTTANTLLGAMYPDVKVAIVSVPTETLEDFEESAVARALTGIHHSGVHFKMVGASGSAKNGKYYFCDATHESLLARRFEMWPEAAITYFGILVSTLKVVRKEADKVVFVVPDLKLGTNDCRGWIRRSLFLKLRLPEGYFYQFRLAFENTQAKGSFKIMDDSVADALGCDIIVPESSVKPGLRKQSVLSTVLGSDVRTFRGPIVLGIREISRPLTFESSYTVLQHAPVDAIATEIVPQAREKIDILKAAWRDRNHEVIVEMIGSAIRSDDESGEEEFQRIIEATLLADGSGELTRHPYIHRQLDRLLARWAYKLMTGGGLDLPAFALADDGILYLHDGKVMSAADWMPRDSAISSSTSDRSLCVRYPVRMNRLTRKSLRIREEQFIAVGVFDNHRVITPPAILDRRAPLLEFGSECLQHPYLQRNEHAATPGLFGLLAAEEDFAILTIHLSDEDFPLLFIEGPLGKTELFDVESDGPFYTFDKENRA